MVPTLAKDCNHVMRPCHSSSFILLIPNQASITVCNCMSNHLETNLQGHHLIMNVLDLRSLILELWQKSHDCSWHYFTAATDVFSNVLYWHFHQSPTKWTLSPKAFPPLHPSDPCRMTNIASSKGKKNQQSSTSNRLQEALQLEGQAKRHATKIRQRSYWRRHFSTVLSNSMPTGSSWWL